MVAVVSTTGELFRLEADLVTWVEIDAADAYKDAAVDIDLAFNEPSRVVLTLPMGVSVFDAVVDVMTAWDGIGASCTIQDVFEASDVDLTDPSLYAVTVYDVKGPRDLYAAITPGVTATTGQVRVRLILAV
jgi:hypothetical protein